MTKSYSIDLFVFIAYVALPTHQSKKSNALKISVSTHFTEFTKKLIQIDIRAICDGESFERTNKKKIDFFFDGQNCFHVNLSITSRYTMHTRTYNWNFSSEGHRHSPLAFLYNIVCALVLKSSINYAAFCRMFLKMPRDFGLKHNANKSLQWSGVIDATGKTLIASIWCLLFCVDSQSKFISPFVLCLSGNLFDCQTMHPTFNWLWDALFGICYSKVTFLN